MASVKPISQSEKGQALPIVLALLALGGLTVLSSLSYATTSLNAGQIISHNVKGIYAAEAGIEYALWCLSRAVSPPAQLPEKVNEMAVTIQYESKGVYTIYLGELIEPGEHNDYLSISGEIVWDESAQAYKYTITVTWQAESGRSVIHLEQIGARLPKGYVYVDGSAAEFPQNLANFDPAETLDTIGAYLLSWEFESPQPSVSQSVPVRTQTFYITGTGNLNGGYTWVVANREDIGAVGEFTGTLYRITAAATHPENSAIKSAIIAEVIVSGATMYTISWQILK